MKCISLVIATLILATSAPAQLTFSGGPVYLGATSDAALTPPPAITWGPLPGGMTLSGDYYVTVPPGPTSGFMLQWGMDRPISGGTAPFLITTAYSGFFSLSPGFTVNASGGAMISGIYTSAGSLVTGTQSVVQFSQSGAFTPISSTNSTLVSSYTYTPGDTLRLRYGVDLNYNGAGGVYDVNFPASVSTSAVPEPASLLVLVAVPALALRRRR